MKINILDSSVYNRISAGEVVENPASVVKELVENAIDAGATSISVRVEDGGIKSICVTDNGFGIEREELPKTILAHATSKISQADDLDTISTLGFRGEALASIAAVSELEILTCAFGEDCGSLLRAKDGKITLSEAASKVGTSVKVKNLFYNTPARYKFLSSKATEESYITRYIFQFILANPDVAIEYFADDGLVYSSSGEGMDSAVQSVFLPKIHQNFIKIEPCNNTANISVSGYVTPPSIFKNNRTQQTVVLNGRIVFDPTISATVQNAYGDRLMNRCFPIFVLNIIMPFDEVDVNVHPNKREVRFVNARKVYGAIYHSVKQALDSYEVNARETLTDELFGKSNENNQNKSHFEPIGGQKDRVGERGINSDNARTAAQNVGSSESEPFVRFTLADALDLVRGNSESDTVRLSENSPVSVDTGICAVSARKLETESNADNVNGSYNSSFSDAIPTDSEGATMLDNGAIQSKSYKIIGQIFNTYLIIESCGKVLFIDQHAMHERILFDEFTEELERAELGVQPLMLPYVFESNVETTSALLNARNVLAECGLEIEEFGRNAVKISTVPSLLGEVNLFNLMTGISEDLTVGKLPAISSLNRNKLASMACKAAIKGGDSLSDEQISRLMDFFAQGKMPLQCPHGRPTAIIYSKYDFEKLFRRKV